MLDKRMIACAMLGVALTFGPWGIMETAQAQVLKAPPGKTPTHPEAPKDKPRPITAEHYRIYGGKGQPASLESLLRAVGSAQVVFLGEFHDDPVAHHLQLLIFQKAHERRKKGDGENDYQKSEAATKLVH